MNHDTTGAKRRPTLLACERDRAEESNEPDCGPVSILSAIDTPRGSTRKRGSARKAPAPRRGWRAAAAGVAAVAAVVAGFAYIDTQTAATWGEASTSAETTLAAAPPNMAGVVAESRAPAPADVVKEPVALPAVIETVAPLPSASPADPFSSLAPVASAKAEQGATTAAAATATGAAPHKHERGSQKPAPSNAKVASAKSDKPTASRSKASDKKLAKAPATANKQDPDVDLIEALVSHMAGKNPVANRREPGVTVLADAGAPKATRDVVMQQEPALPTGELVRRCMTLGWLESQLCRARICAGQWGADPACPLSQQQSAEYRR